MTFGHYDVGIVTVIETENTSVLSALQIDQRQDRIPLEGDLYWQGTVQSKITMRSLSVIIQAQGVSGEHQAATAATKLIERFTPQIVIQVGIAAGIRDQSKIGNVFIPTHVLDYSKSVALTGGTTQLRPLIVPLPHPVQQCLVGFPVDVANWQDRFRRIHGPDLTPPSETVGEFELHVACPPSRTFDGVIASDNTLLRNPEVLQQLAGTIHEQIRGGEMEAAGLVTACSERAQQVPWFIIRGISDFGDELKHDGFHRLASCAAASYLAYFLEDGLDLRLFPPPPGGGSGGPTMTNSIDRALRESIGRCQERWEAIGVKRKMAISFASDMMLGLPSAEMFPTADRPLLIITGEGGSGKSLAAERVYQKALIMLTTQAQAPIPVYLRSQDAKRAVGSLAETILISARRLGNPDTNGVIAVVDGLDEVGIEFAYDLLQEARTLVNTYDSMRILMTSRPQPLIEGIPESHLILPMSESDAEALIRRVWENQSSYAIHAEMNPSLREAIRRPLFAIMYALFQQGHAGTTPHSRAEMLAWIIQRSLDIKRIDLTAATALLRKLAIRTFQRGSDQIPQAEVGHSWEIEALLYSRLIAHDGNCIAFSLRIYAEWFAAQALLTDESLLTGIFNHSNRIDDWRYPLAIAVSIADTTQIARILTALIEQNPALAGRLLHDAISLSNHDSSSVPPPVEECGIQIRKAMTAWVAGIGSLSKLIAPISSDGMLRTLGIDTCNARGICSGWYYGEEVLPEIVPFPSSPRDREFSYSFRSVSFTQPGWEWRYSFDELISKSEQYLKKRAFPATNVEGPLVQELIWLAARSAIGMKNHPHEPILFGVVEDSIQKMTRQFGGEEPCFDADGLRIDASLLQEVIARKCGQGINSFIPPWPLPIEYTSERWRHIWGGYTEFELVEYVKAVFLGALQAYQELVEMWFQPFASCLSTYNLLPAHIVGTIRISQQPPGSPPAFFDWPGLDWYMDPKQLGEPNEVNILSIPYRNDETRNRVNERFNERRQCLKTLRPATSRWIVLHESHYMLSHHFGEARPIASLVYDWLKDDLKRFDWMR